MKFELHPRLRQDCIQVGRFRLCRLLLMDDCRFPWFVLVPQRAETTEIHQLCAADRIWLMEESCRLGRALVDRFQGAKLNIGALGNVVPQLHIHHVVRYPDDPAWPGPVWGFGQAVSYPMPQLHELLGGIRQLLPELETE